MTLKGVSEYNSDQWTSIQAIRKVLNGLHPTALEQLRQSVQPYLRFRDEVKEYQERYFSAICRETCFDTGLSACCSFESIITFFADHVITVLSSKPEDVDSVIQVLERPNNSGKCVYLGENGCLWRVPPVSCAMFFCDDAKKTVFSRRPEADALWEALREKEKDYTWPTKSVLFDELEDFFLQRGAQTRHMFFHFSPGLLRLKAEAGLKSRFVAQERPME
jgi:hypothetical protein